MSDDDLPASPAGLGPAGRSMWRDMIDRYNFEVHELRLLEQAARALDTIDRLEELVTTEGLIVEGAKGGLRTHPAIAEIRQQRGSLARMVAALGLPPDETRGGETPRQRRARRAAESRWSKGA